MQPRIPSASVLQVTASSSFRNIPNSRVIYCRLPGMKVAVSCSNLGVVGRIFDHACIYIFDVVCAALYEAGEDGRTWLEI